MKRLLGGPKLSAPWKTAMYQEPESGRNGRSDIVWPSVVTWDLLPSSLLLLELAATEEHGCIIDLIGIQLEILDEG